MDMINNFINDLSMPKTIIALIIGALLILFGYRIKRMGFFIVWFLLGYIIMNNYVMDFINSNVSVIAESDLYQMLLPIGGGLLLALLGFSIEKICVGGICFALTMIITATYFGTDMQTLAIGAVIGVLAGGIGVFLMKPAMIVATSLIGAYIIVIACLKLFTIDAETYYFPILIGSTAIGIVVQFLTTRNMG